MVQFSNRIEGVAGTDVTPANSAAGGDAFNMVVTGATSTIKYGTTPWGTPGCAITTPAGATTEANHLRWINLEDTAPRGLVVRPLWINQTPSAQVVLTQIRNTSEQTMTSLKLTGTSGLRRLICAARTTDIPATFSTDLQLNHLYWVGHYVVQGTSGEVGWILWDSDRTTVLQSQSATGVDVLALPPGRFYFGRAAGSTSVPDVDWLADVQAGHYASGWPEPLSAPAPVIAPIPSQEVEPGETVTVTATLESGDASTWTWTQISGPTVGLVPSGATVTFVAPYLMDTDQIVLSVQADDSEPVTATITVRPELMWVRSEEYDWSPSGIIRL